MVNLCKERASLKHDGCRRGYYKLKNLRVFAKLPNVWRFLVQYHFFYVFIRMPYMISSLLVAPRSKQITVQLACCATVSDTTPTPFIYVSRNEFIPHWYQYFSFESDFKTLKTVTHTTVFMLTLQRPRTSKKKKTVFTSFPFAKAISWLYQYQILHKDCVTITCLSRYLVV